ncbi:uncharacterized protein N7446_002189 [Penicillium canescens]|uniref:Uncharacterized protein n=1 Tax=Penicillium canescens TaxID=5083 RepID=A0AAD6N9I6_PENCN|nr:uncharacterized protein N7446_002189 [Penicillium canescens]KAJ6043992.1 hypothetical protein N7460_005347 [Penicillium canescens]KAJ6055465.1 hypothetical protein N7444_004563 [Penicillium canescens]KAJ6074412.1 hypothetical protein N7446_002189 [Penicillium canescens]
MDQYAYHMNYLMNQKQEPLPLFPTRTVMSRPGSEATEIFEDEYEYNRYRNSSPMRSVASFGTGSISTASTPDTVTTPESTGLTAFDFLFDEKHTRGPNGPHLFRSSESDTNSAMDVVPMAQETPISTTGPFHHRASKFDPYRRDTPVPNGSTAPTPEPRQPVQRQQSSHVAQPASVPIQIEPRDWTPFQVKGWLQSLNFEDDVVEKFFENDISGSIILDLDYNFLFKELEIKSFGKRYRLMSSIDSLRGGGVSMSSDTHSARSRNSSVASGIESTPNTSYVSGNGHTSYSTAGKYVPDAKPRPRRQRSDSEVSKRNDLLPDDSVSIVAIEQGLPKVHKCKKGEACKTWQKQQKWFALVAQDLPLESLGPRCIVAGDPGNPKTAPNLLKSPMSQVTPSLVASSDLMGPQHPSFQLSQERLKEVQPRDPQENVRNFLNFQSLDRLQTVDQPATPPTDHLSSPGSKSPDSAKITPTLADHLRHLPKLRIPSMHDSSEGSVITENMSALRTVTPSILSRRNQFNDRTAIPGEQQSFSSGAIASPGDFYRRDPCYRSETPLSDIDVPVTAVPIGPVAREDSQSVPPNMRFGNERYIMADPIIRPSSSKAEGHRRYPSIHDVATLNPLKEGYTMSPIETPEDLQNTPRAPQFRNNALFPSTRRGEGDVTHSGWMKKRKTTKLIRHDWEDHHFTLKGTQLAMHDNEASARLESKALEYIDVDDYAVACSSFASRSKLTAAFKKTVLKRNENPLNASAFQFSLIPTPNGSAIIDRKTLFLNSGKSHHFSVKTRDQRIDWMRELMLAKALKRGRDTGAEVTFNGANMI